MQIAIMNANMEVDTVSMMTVRNIPEEVHRALRARAQLHGRSTEAEVRAILEQAVKPDGHLPLGSFLRSLGPDGGLNDEESALFERDQSPAKPVDFE